MPCHKPPETNTRTHTDTKHKHTVARGKCVTVSNRGRQLSHKRLFEGKKCGEPGERGEHKKGWRKGWGSNIKHKRRKAQSARASREGFSVNPSRRNLMWRHLCSKTTASY